MIPAMVLFGWLTAAGYGAPQAAAIIANADIESGLDPAAVSPKGGVGLFQWHGARRRALLADALAAGADWRDPGFQLAFMRRELAAMRGYRRFAALGDAGLAAVLFAKEYERPPAFDAALRAARARRIYREIGS